MAIIRYLGVSSSTKISSSNDTYLSHRTSDYLWRTLLIRGSFRGHFLAGLKPNVMDQSSNYRRWLTIAEVKLHTYVQSWSARSLPFWWRFRPLDGLNGGARHFPSLVGLIITAFFVATSFRDLAVELARPRAPGGKPLPQWLATVCSRRTSQKGRWIDAAEGVTRTFNAWATGYDYRKRTFAS
jgi:hypothetical protein